MSTATSVQPSLFDAVVLAPLSEPDWFGRDLPRPETLDERFAAFDKANPSVYGALRALCLDTRRAGVKRWSIDAAMHVVRWRYRIQTKGDEEYGLNNSFSAFYARKLMAQEPELAGFFELRKRRHENGDGDDD